MVKNGDYLEFNYNLPVLQNLMKLHYNQKTSSISHHKLAFDFLFIYSNNSVTRFY